MSVFNKAGECAKCERDFTERSAQLGQGLNADELCRNCVRHEMMRRIDDDLADHLANHHGSGLGAC